MPTDLKSQRRSSQRGADASITKPWNVNVLEGSGPHLQKALFPLTVEGASLAAWCLKKETRRNEIGEKGKA